MKNKIIPYDITLNWVFGKMDDSLAREVIDTWQTRNLIPEGQSGRERANHVAMVVRNDKNEIIGVSTAIPIYVEQLRNHMFNYRCMLVPNHKYPGLLAKLTVATRDHLEKIHKTYDPYCIGIIAEIQNQKMNELRREAVYLASGLTFIGYSKRGFQIRVYYFKGVNI